MRTFDASPFYRSTVGFDRLFDLLDNRDRSDWPPYNIEKKGENEYAITMAVAGFGHDDIEVMQHGTQLLVAGQRKGEKAGPNVLHQGIAARSFKQTFDLAEHVRVAQASLENGLLSIELVRELPERLKPRKIEIGSAAPKPGDQASQLTIEQDDEPQRKVG